jgi:hypothetical protein
MLYKICFSCRVVNKAWGLDVARCYVRDESA